MKIRFKQTITRSTLGVLSGLLILFFNNCRGRSGEVLQIDNSSTSPSISENVGAGSGGTLCEQDIKNLFNRGWQSFLQTNCAICHSNGPGKGRFANKDLAIAYDDFMQVGYVKVGNNAVNSTHNPPYTGVQHTQTVNELKLEWQKGLQDYAKCTGDTSAVPEENLVESISLKTTAQEIGLEKDGDKKTLTWKLNSDLIRTKGAEALPNKVGGKISITVTRLKNAAGFTYYTFTSPILSDVEVDTRIQSIFINLNGFLLNYPTTFSRVDKSIRKGSNANDLSGLLSTGSLVAPKVVLPTDSVSLSFVNISEVSLPPAPPPILVQIAGEKNVVIQPGAKSVEMTLSLSSPAVEPIVVTVSENTDLCGTAVVYTNSNTVFKQVATSCLPEVYSKVCPSESCASEVVTFGRARSVVGATWNRYDWDYKFSTNTVTFNVGESSKTVTIMLSSDERRESNRLLSFDIVSVLGSVNIGANKTVHYIINKFNNPLPSGDVLTFTELMSPNSGILGQNCVKCHNSSITAGGYDMTNYEMMISKKVLIPGDVASKMYVRMHPTPEFLAKPMPQDGFLTQSLILEVEKWLLDGAKNN